MDRQKALKWVMMITYLARIDCSGSGQAESIEVGNDDYIFPGRDCSGSGQAESIEVGDDDYIFS